MQLLLDTHVLLWWLADMPQLGERVRKHIDRSTNTIYVSAASAWEIEIKRAIGKLIAPSDLAEAIAQSGFRPLSMTLSHAVTAGRLPQHHNDPFDRMLIAQAKTEGLQLVTHDRAFHNYDVDLINAGV